MGGGGGGAWGGGVGGLNSGRTKYPGQTAEYFFFCPVNKSGLSFLLHYITAICHVSEAV